MERVVLRHLSGSRAGTKDQWPLGAFREALIGRDFSADIRYEKEDDRVSRRHARLVRDEEHGRRFLVVDLDSTNGTFVNRQRVDGSSVLLPGDHIRLGPDGPEFVFDIETVEGVVPGEPLFTSVTAGNGRRTASWALLAVLFLAGIAAASALMLLARDTTTPELVGEAGGQAGGRAGDILERIVDSTFRLDVGWSLVLAETGGQLYHEHRIARDEVGLSEAASAAVPLYVRHADGTIEPQLSLDPGELGQNKPVAGRLTGSGFVVDNAGALLTAGIVVQPWKAPYRLPGVPGVLIEAATGVETPLEQPPSEWIPASTRYAAGSGREGSVEGRLDYLEVRMADGGSSSFSLRATSVEDLAAAIEPRVARVPVPAASFVEQFDERFEAAAPGSRIRVIGFAAIEPASVQAAHQRPVTGREQRRSTVGSSQRQENGRSRALCLSISPESTRASAADQSWTSPAG